MSIQRFINFELQTWLTHTTHPALTTSILEGINNIAVYYGSDEPASQYVETILYNIEEKGSDYLGILVDDLIAEQIKLITTCGVLIEDDSKPSLSIITRLLTALLNLPDYEDYSSIYNIIELGNRNHERFCQIMHTVDPLIDEGELANIIKSVNNDFFERLEAIIKPHIALTRQKEQQAHMKEIEQLTRHINYINRIDATLNNGNLIKQNKDLLVCLRKTLPYFLENSTTREFFLTELLNYIYDNYDIDNHGLTLSVKDYGLLVGGLITIYAKEHNHQDIDPISIEEIPSLGLLDDLDQQMQLTAQVKRVLELSYE